MKQNWVNAYVLYCLSAQQGLKEAKQKLQSLEPKLPVEQWQQAQSIIQKMKVEKG